ncbi:MULTISPECIES: bifunctional adenosylcobinamide kinase/adenosylcobinamide-phosphate guanylyltransferase [Thermocrispum]|uniref:Adenosylcobinamide kinase n=1 Tax=Thermocrispum agreste TaxID=37925 RepID=A0ABD6FB61_9PSEU|nr:MULTISPECIES: bifunctional adenosylcobinamide kinase/adenosylcobinamide-phosphate guanylyltransferase [Thermocrispum]
MTSILRAALAAVVRRGAHVLDGLAAQLAPPRRTLILGGARSGKSSYAEQLLAGRRRVIYLATGAPPGDDEEWAERIRRHRERRAAHWETVETIHIAAALRAADAPVLIDCLATWLARICDEAGAWDAAPGWKERLEHEVEELVQAWRAARVPVVAVSNEVGSGIVPSTPSGRLFRDELGVLNSRMASESDAVLLMVAGRPIRLEAP